MADWLSVVYIQSTLGNGSLNWDIGGTNNMIEPGCRGCSKTRAYLCSKTRCMSRLFSGSSIPDWVLNGTNGQLFQIILERKITIIKRVRNGAWRLSSFLNIVKKQAIFATNKVLFDSVGNNLEVLLTEISDGHYYVPALIIPEVMRHGLK